MTEHLGNHVPSNFIKSQIYTNKAFLHKDYQFSSENPENRRFFILNQNPFNDQSIITVHTTTQIKRRKAARKKQPEVLVGIPKGTRSYITDESIIDCQSYKVWYKQELEREIEHGIITPLESLPAGIMEQLYQAISYSKTIPDMDKRLIFPEM